MDANMSHGQATRRRTWRSPLMPIALLGLALFGFLFLSSRWSTPSTPNSVLRRALDGWVSPETIRTLERDERLRRNYIDILDLTARGAEWLTERYPDLELQDKTDALKLHIRELTEAPSNKRSSLVLRQSLGTLLGDAANATEARASGFISDQLSSITNSLAANAAPAGMFLGIGIGEGTAAGLNLSSAANAKRVGAKVAAANNMEATGLNGAIENAGSGVVSTLLGSVDLKSLAAGQSSQLAAQAGPAAQGLATGIGNGFVQGFKLGKTGQGSTVQQRAAQGADKGTLDVPDVLNKFGFGLVDTVASNVDVKRLQSSVGSQEQLEMVKAQLAPAALGLSSGLSGGFVNGLKLNNVAPPQGTGVPDIAGSFGYGLTNTVASNVDIKQITQSLVQMNNGSGLNTDMIMKQLPAAASGLGTGLGLGASVGLGAQPDPGELPMKPMPDGQIDTAGVVRNFAFGLTSRFLGNGTLGKIAADPSLLGVPAGGGSSLMPDVDFGKVAGGLARGLVQGAGDGITAMGGLQAIIDGNATNVTDVPLTPINMDDSVRGAAVGLGQGLGSQGVAVGKVLASQVKLKFAMRKREVPSDVTARGLEIRQDPATPTPGQGSLAFLNGTTLNISNLFSAETISTVVQKGLDTISCEGVGGLGLIGVGLVKSGTIKLNANMNLTAFKELVPEGKIHFNNAKTNNYELDMRSALNNAQPLNIGGINGSFRVNGNGIVAFVAILVIHIALAIGVMLTLLPLVVGLESTQNLLGRVGKAHVLAWSDKWINISWIFLIGPSIIIILATGFTAKGNAGHMQDAHSILGFLTALLAFAATAMHFVVKVRQAGSARLANARRVVLNVLMFAIVITSILGFGELSGVTVCLVQVVPFSLAVGLGFGVSGAFSVGSAIASVDLFWALRKPKKNGDAPAKDVEMSGGGGGASSAEKRAKIKISPPMRRI